MGGGEGNEEGRVRQIKRAALTKLLVVIVTLLEAVIEEILSGCLLGYSVFLGQQVTISLKLGTIWLFP